MADSESDKNPSPSQPVFYTGISSKLSSSSSIPSPHADSDLNARGTNNIATVIVNNANMADEECSNTILATQPQRCPEQAKKSAESAEIDEATEVHGNQESTQELSRNTAESQKLSIKTANGDQTGRMADRVDHHKTTEESRRHTVENKNASRKQSNEKEKRKKEKKPKEEKKKEIKDFKLLAAEFGTEEYNYRRRFRKLILDEPERTKSSNIPYCYDPRKIRQLMRECLEELVTKILKKPHDKKLDDDEKLEKDRPKTDEHVCSHGEALNDILGKNIAFSSDPSDDCEQWER